MAKKVSAKNLKKVLSSLAEMATSSALKASSTHGETIAMSRLILATLMLACVPVTANVPPPPPPKPCCRYCTSSKACGDGCISYENACHKAPGCACTVGVRAP